TGRLPHGRRLLLLLACGPALLAVLRSRCGSISALPERAAGPLLWSGFRALCGGSGLGSLAEPVGGGLLHLAALIAHLDLAGIVRRGVLETLLASIGDETLGLDLGGLRIGGPAHLDLEVVEVSDGLLLDLP